MKVEVFLIFNSVLTFPAYRVIGMRTYCDTVMYHIQSDVGMYAYNNGTSLSTPQTTPEGYRKVDK